MEHGVKRGEVRWYRFSQPDKQRPVVILTRNSVIEYLHEITIAPVTTVVRDIPSEVFLARNDGVPRNCAINCDHIQTVSKSRIGALITTLPSARLLELNRAISFALDLGNDT